MRSIKTDQPFELLIRANPVNHKWEFGIEGIAFIGYSFKKFYECGVSITKGELMEDYNF
jgi:hypothetical protein